MLPKSERLSVRDIALLENGRSVFGTHLSIRYSPARSNTSAAGSLKKFSVTVSKKVAKTAVLRNRIRRRVYVALREAKSSISKSVFLIVIPKKECDTLAIAEIKSELTALFNKAGI
jgi:ribonuclease P protein component